MTTVNNDVSALEKLGLSARKEQPKTNELGQEQFLELMMAQMQNQDPTSPTDTNEFMSQIAQFSASSGIVQLQESAVQLLSSIQSSQALQASTLVGRSVLIPSNKAVLPGDGAVQGRVDLSDAAQELHVNVYDSAGQLVRKMNLGSQPSGLVSYEWDGRNDSGERLPAGEYEIRSEAVVGGSAYEADTLVIANVDSVTVGRNGQAPTLNLGELGSVGFSQVRQIL